MYTDQTSTLLILLLLFILTVLQCYHVQLITL